MRLLWIALLAVAALPAQRVRDEPVPERPPVDEQELADGKRLFLGHCAPCHGLDGRGASGPNLARPDLRRAADPESLFLTIDLGINGTEMPAGWQLHDREIWKIAAFVEALGKTEPEPLPGDPVAGAAIYSGKGGCVGCHWLNGGGGLQGPPLDAIGAARSLAHLREALLEPAAAIPDGFLLVSATRSDGSKVEGVRLGEDPFTIQIRDYGGGLHSLVKTQLSSIERLEKKSSMPSYEGRLSAAELDDLVSYLATLRGSS